MDLFKLFGTIVVNNADANKAIDETTGKASGMADTFDQTGGSVTKTGGGMSGVFRKLGTAVATYMSVSAIKNFGMGCIQAAADVSAANSQFTQVFGDLEAQASKSLTGIANTAGISENRMKGSYTQIAAFAKTTGMDTESALNLTNRAMVAVADSAAFYDRSLEDTTESLQSFLKGNYENDAALGLSCTETTRNAAANDLYGKSFKDLSESQKQLTLLKMVEDANKLSGAMGQASRESDTWTNQTGNLQQAWTDFQAVLGQPIVGMATSAVSWLAQKVGGLTQKITEGTNPTQWLIDKISALKDWFVDVGAYAASTLSPIFDDLKTAFTAVKDAVQPIIDKLAEYVSSGQAAEDITTAVKTAVDLLGTAYQTVKDFITGVVDGFKDAVEWGKQHETGLTLIGVAVGTLTAAIVAYNIAAAIKKAGGIAEIAQLGILQVQLWALTAAETAHTIATNIATAATTAFGAVMSFVTSPITLVIVAIGALIAIGVLLYKNWDTVKEYCLKAWEAIKTGVSKAIEATKTFCINTWNAIKTAVSTAVNAIKTVVTNVWNAIKNAVSTAVNAIKTFVTNTWNAIKDKVSNVVNGIKSTVTNVWNSIKSATSNAWNNVKSFVTNAVNGVKTKVSSVFDSVKSKVTSVWDGIKAAIKGPIESARDLVKGAIDKIKGYFDFSFTWPKLKLPHFSFSGSWNPFDWPDKFPKLGVEWYAKAMNNPMLMNDPTIFGYNPATGNLMGGGEAGTEVVAGADALMAMIGRAVAANSEVLSERLVSILTAILEAITGGNQEMIRALLAGQTIVLNNREFARAVREYA